MAATSATNVDETFADIEETFGFVPGWIEAIPEEDIVHEWPVMKQYVLGETELDPKVREFIGLAVAATVKCPYCQLFHRGAAEMHGATDAELEEVGVIASISARWSTMIHAQHYDYDTFAEEFERIGEHLQEHQQAAD